MSASAERSPVPSSRGDRWEGGQVSPAAAACVAGPGSQSPW